MDTRYSVALCTYNGAKFIREQLDSIVHQSIPPSQIVVSDDGSKDSTIEIVNEYLSDKGIRYIVCSNHGKHGVSGNFLNAMNLCTEEIIFTSDQDDYWMENKAEKMLAVYENIPNAMLVFSNGELVDTNMKSLNCDIWKAVGISPEKCAVGNWFQYLLKNCLITGATMSIRKTLLDGIDDIPSEWLHDGWLAWAAVAYNGLVPCPEILIKYRQHGLNVVGMKPVNALQDRLDSWLNNFDSIVATRQLRYRRYSSLQRCMGNKFTAYQNKNLSDCIFFWKILANLTEYHRGKRLVVIIRLYLFGYYHRFFVGTRGFVRDILFSLKK